MRRSIKIVPEERQAAVLQDNGKSVIIRLPRRPWADVNSKTHLVRRICMLGD